MILMSDCRRGAMEKPLRLVNIDEESSVLASILLGRASRLES